ncbi:60S ribosomal protein L7-2 [Hordeum vulgare]|nr:60S ribosomal protein L7-2 [Hordeum vulgare]
MVASDMKLTRVAAGTASAPRLLPSASPRTMQERREYEAQDKELVQLKREARMKGGFYVSPESKLLFIVHQEDLAAFAFEIFNGVFLKVNKATITMLRRVEPYVAYGSVIYLPFES